MSLHPQTSSMVIVPRRTDDFLALTVELSGKSDAGFLLCTGGRDNGIELDKFLPWLLLLNVGGRDLWDGHCAWRIKKKLGTSVRIGESIVRRFSAHDETTFTIEQDISLYIKERASGCGWTVVVWLDSGRDVSEGPCGPWDKGSHSDKPGFECVPVIQHRPREVLRSDPMMERGIATPGRLSPPGSSSSPAATPGNSSSKVHTAQSASLLHLFLGQMATTLGPPEKAPGVMLALHELFAFAAHSECQFLNFMGGLVSREMDEHVVYLERVVALLQHLLQQQPDIEPSRVGGKQAAMDTPAGQDAATCLLGDFQELLDRANGLLDALEESAKGLDQTARFGRLSLLAFLFLPLSLSTAIFGMNFREFGTGDLSIWVLAPVASLLFALSMLLAFPSLVARARERRGTMEN
ncbi:hypothetical protein QQX98_002829 [Neonectria punicea]|uniref:CorA-like Mg2+ transporter protein n=1 Tax=Neonectria punicea TaxID=979145 RepID=A0ABR1HIM3_9HYPO